MENLPNKSGEYKTKPDVQVREMVHTDLESAHKMLYQSHLDTDVNEKYGATEEAIRKQWEPFSKIRPGQQEDLRKQLGSGKYTVFVAVDEKNEVIGVAQPETTDAGVQRIASLYVDKEYHGAGVASQLMDKMMDYFDLSKSIELEVIAFSERAQAFYKKWGFEKVPGSEMELTDVLPGLKMVRPANLERDQ